MFLSRHAYGFGLLTTVEMCMTIARWFLPGHYARLDKREPGVLSTQQLSVLVYLDVLTRVGNALFVTRVFAGFSHIVAISDVNNDTIYECLTAKRTEYDREAKTATYIVLFKGHHGGQKKKVGFHVSEGPSPDLFEFTEDEQCILYVSKGVEENVPRHCIDHFADICGVAVPTYSRDLCPDEEDD
ncbi:hypothetical protein HPB50_000288 [Hyalomma asiaticum]|uniref:Uncharacterized protein n=1 Tax=Hyalomma asiaticum TaxID=266040 RepID=A0ACB7RQW5_HYAAI|nr:hypothetical protein HPB50_000288 [Hyalomma asiaticum]